jgi:two-component system CAI-1 autoinducer sensor kinase/phosphatase CqsS
MQAWHARISCVAREGAYAIFVLEFPQPQVSTRHSRFPSIHRSR